MCLFTFLNFIWKFLKVWENGKTPGWKVKIMIVWGWICGWAKIMNIMDIVSCAAVKPNIEVKHFTIFFPESNSKLIVSVDFLAYTSTVWQFCTWFESCAGICSRYAIARFARVANPRDFLNFLERLVVFRIYLPCGFSFNLS